MLTGTLGSTLRTLAADAVTFNILVESVTKDDTLALPDGTKTKAHLSAGLYVASSNEDTLFKQGAKATGRQALSGLQKMPIRPRARDRRL